MHRRTPRLSLQVRFPLLIAGLLLGVVVIFAALAYRVASHAALATARERAQGVVNQLASMIGTEISTGARRMAAAAADPSLVRLATARSSDSTAALRLLTRLTPDTTLSTLAELRDARGRLLLASRSLVPVDSEAFAAAPPRPDSVHVSALYRVRDNVYYEVSVPVRVAGAPSVLILRRRLDSSTGGRKLAAMLGTDARLFLGNRDGALWTDLGAPAESVMVHGVIATGLYRRNGEGRIGATAPAPGSPWQLGAEFSQDQVLQRTWALISEMLVIALMVMAGGALLGWLVSRRITRPLRDLTDRVEHVSRHPGTESIGPRQRDELTRLADAFERMETRVQDGERRLRESEAQYRQLFDLNPNPMWVYDRRTLAFLAVNEAASRHYGYSQDEFMAMTIRDIRPPEDIPRLEAAVRTEPQDRPDVSEWRHRTRDGQLIDVEIRGRPVVFLGHEAELVLVRDVTEFNRLEARLRQAQRMEAVGRLAGGIAHDFNNILSAVLGYADLLLKGLPEDDPRRVDAQEIHAAGARGAALTRQLLTFSRQEISSPEVLDVNAAVEGVHKLLRRLIEGDIDIELRLGASHGGVRMDRSHLDQVIINLALNARDAMPGGGTVIIETADVALDDLHQRGSRVLPAGRYVMLAVSDSGVGIAREDQERIFEPFFTTKGPGKGTGLGLSTVYGIVQQSGGSVIVYSEPGHGSTFKVYLPLVSPAGHAAEVHQAPGPHGTPHETILFVEDEPALQRMGREILVRLGYTVLDVANAEEALAICASHVGSIDLVATDVVMPGLNGRQLVEQLRAARPGVRVLFMSGYTDDALLVRGVGERGTGFLQKPFSAEMLARRVRQLLDGD